MASSAATAASGSGSSGNGHGPHFYAQQMNNSAAACIEIGLYDRAITSLKRALRLSKAQQPPRNSLCDCYQCTLDGCIVRSSSTDAPEEPTTSSTPSSSIVADIRRRRLREGIRDDTEEESYVSKTPIKVKCQGHTMGPALYLIITFNLALTNHLMALESSDAAALTNPRQPPANPRDRHKKASKARELYKLTYDMQANLIRHEQRQPPPGDTASQGHAVLTALKSLRFEMILLNNLSQCHALTNNPVDREDCLRRLLATMMIVVDHNVQQTTTAPAPAPPQRTNNNEGEGEANDEDGSNGSSSSHSSSFSERFWRIDLDGFWKTTAHLVLRDEYTSGAA